MRNPPPTYPRPDPPPSPPKPTAGLPPAISAKMLRTVAEINRDGYLKKVLTLLVEHASAGRMEAVVYAAFMTDEVKADLTRRGFTFFQKPFSDDWMVQW